jgi:hypothetical protein
VVVEHEQRRRLLLHLEQLLARVAEVEDRARRARDRILQRVPELTAWYSAAPPKRRNATQAAAKPSRHWPW